MGFDNKIEFAMITSLAKDKSKIVFVCRMIFVRIKVKEFAIYCNLYITFSI